MRLLLIFIIFILGVFYTFGDDNCCEQCCEQCCECLGNCCNKEEFYLEKSKVVNLEEIKNLVSTDWYNNKGEGTLFILYEKTNGTENQNLDNNDVIKVTKYKNGFRIDKDFITENDNNTQKWALFEIIYKKEGNEEENEEEEIKENEEEIKKENNEEEIKKETKYLYCSDIESIEGYGIFYECKQHISISVIACDTSGVTDMFFMFSRCSSLTKLDLSKFDTKNVENMSCMFSNCSSLTELDLSNFNTEKVTSIDGMFLDCKKLNNLNLSKFDTKNVENMAYMFSDCSSLTELDLFNFNTEKVTNMEGMFYNCSSLTDLDLPNFNTGNVEKMGDMFNYCNSLQTVTFNKNLNNKIIQQLEILGLTEKVVEEGNIITLEKTTNLVFQ